MERSKHRQMSQGTGIYTSNTRKKIRQGDWVLVGGWDDESGHYGGANPPGHWLEYKGRVVRKQANGYGSWWAVTDCPFALVSFPKRRLIHRSKGLTP